MVTGLKEYIIAVTNKQDKQKHYLEMKAYNLVQRQTQVLQQVMTVFLPQSRIYLLFFLHARGRGFESGHRRIIFYAPCPHPEMKWPVTSKRVSTGHNTRKAG